MQQKARALQVLEEADTKARSIRRAFDQARYVGHDETFFGIDTNDAEVRVQRGKRVVGDLRAGGGDGADQRALAGVGQAKQADVGQHAQFEADFELFTLFAIGFLARGAIGRAT